MDKNYKSDFPIFKRYPNLIYLDSAATTQKPKSVLDSLVDFYETCCANINRGNYHLSDEATKRWEASRALIKTFIGSDEKGELIFTKNATESLNLVAYCLGSTLKPTDLVAVSILEHHSNFVPWQQLSKRFGFRCEIIPTDNEGYIDEVKYNEILNREPKVVALTHCSHVLGNIVPIERLGAQAKAQGAKVVVDGTQMVSHSKLNLSELPVDFYAFSGHKMFGPNGIGCLYSTDLESLPPFLYGGDMVNTVTETNTSFAPLPRRFEAGTPPVADAIALGAAVDYLADIESVNQKKKILTEYLFNSLSTLPELTIHGPKNLKDRAGIVSFSVAGVHSHDISEVLNSYNICVRSGHHCAQPLMNRLGVESLVRASVHVYNENDDIDNLIKGIKESLKLFL